MITWIKDNVQMVMWFLDFFPLYEVKHVCSKNTIQLDRSCLVVAIYPNSLLIWDPHICGYLVDIIYHRSSTRLTKFVSDLWAIGSF